MAKRHTMRSGDLESIFGRLEELVLANSGEDAFEEIFKLLVAKLYAEMYAPKGEGFRVLATAPRTADAINYLLIRASEKWKGIAPTPLASRLTNEHLAICVEALQNYSLHDASGEALDAAFEYLISRSAKGAKGQYFTPRYVIDCCVQMLRPSPDEIVLDPACGSGGFLIHTLNAVQVHHPAMDVAAYSKHNLWGCDFDARALRVAKALMLIAGDGQSHLYRLNSLLTPAANRTLFDTYNEDDTLPRLTIEDITRADLRNFRGFDIIMTNPPFAGEVQEKHFLQTHALYREGRVLERDILFLERCVQLLRPGGRLAIVLPNNKFSAPTWTYVREWLNQQMRIVAVLGLGRNTFLPHTHQKASVLFAVKRERPRRRPEREDILFLISEKDGKDSRGQIIERPDSSRDEPAWTRTDHDLAAFVEQLHQFTTAQGIPWGED